jgi:hypothetical protein
MNGRPSTARVAAKPTEAAKMPAKRADTLPAHQKLFEQYIETLKTSLELDRWSTDVVWNSASTDDCDAQVEIIEGRYAALIWLHDDFFILSRAEQRRVVVHELLHLHSSGVMSAVSIASHAMAKPTRKVAVKLIRDAEEHMIDSLSVAVAKFLPLPPWEEPNQQKRRPASTA